MTNNVAVAKNVRLVCEFLHPGCPGVGATMRDMKVCVCAAGERL